MSLIIPVLNIQLTQEQSPIPFEFSQYLPENNNVEFDKIEPETIQLSAEDNLQIPIENKEGKTAEDFNWIQFIFLIYFLGALVVGIRFFIGFRKLIALIKTSSGEKMSGFVWLKMPTGFQPSSFFHWVMMDEEKLKDMEILNHELVHVKQWHSLDVLLFEFSTILLWFNPVIYLFKKDLRQIHEYLADTVAMGENPKYYAQKMLEIASGNKPALLTNSFAFLPLKHRIKMLTKIKSSPISKLNFVLSLPVIGLLFFTFSCVKEDFAALSEPGALSQRKIKSIKSYYLDEMGDQPERNGTVIGEVYFDMEGKIESIRTSYGSVLQHYPEKLNRSQLFSVLQLKSPDAIWFIDGFHYNFGASDLVQPSDFKDNIKEVSDDFELLEGGAIEKYSYVQEIKLTGKYEPYSFKSRTDNYFEEGKRIKQEQWYSNGGAFNHGGGIDYIYDDLKKLTQISRYLVGKNGNKALQTEGHLTYNENHLIDTYSSFEKSEFKRKAHYFYNETGLRTSNQVYNTNSQLEFTINFEYEFYD